MTKAKPTRSYYLVTAKKLRRKFFCRKQIKLLWEYYPTGLRFEKRSLKQAFKWGIDVPYAFREELIAALVKVQRQLNDKRLNRESPGDLIWKVYELENAIMKLRNAYYFSAYNPDEISAADQRTTLKILDDILDEPYVRNVLRDAFSEKIAT